MRIGSSIFLIALGAILAFAIQAQVSFVDITLVGYILMAVGVIGLIASLLLAAPRRREPGVGVAIPRRPRHRGDRHAPRDARHGPLAPDTAPGTAPAESTEGPEPRSGPSSSVVVFDRSRCVLDVTPKAGLESLKQR